MHINLHGKTGLIYVNYLSLKSWIDIMNNVRF